VYKRQGLPYYPTGIAITPDGAYAYVTTYANPGTVSVIATATNTVVATVTVGAYPSSVAITPQLAHPRSFAWIVG